MSFDAVQAKRYARHFVLKEIGIKGQKKLSESKVLVIGAGGLGSPAIMYLASASVKSSKTNNTYNRENRSE